MIRWLEKHNPFGPGGEVLMVTITILSLVIGWQIGNLLKVLWAIANM